jgi:hypothetical protein
MERRDFLASLAALGGLGALDLALPGARAAATAAGDHTDDWRWLLGSWDVHHRRLKERLVGDTRWEEFAGKSAMWLTMGGLGTIDDNLMELPGGAYRGLGVRAFDPASKRWAIWWLDGRSGRLDPPVHGGFEGDGGTFVGRDTLRGKPIVMRFRWHDIHGPRPWWEQAFSPDDGATWEVNWRNWFTRTAADPAPLPALPDAPHDFDFLAGQWKVHHRRLQRRLAGSHDWDEFEGSLHNWPVLGGHGNVGDNVMAFPGGAFRGMGLRTYDRDQGHWLSWWLDGRDPVRIGTPLRGRFEGDTGTFRGEEQVDGRTVATRVVWSKADADAPQWEQSASADGGKTWETNWISRFERVR